MTCEFIEHSSGARMIVCSRTSGKEKCKWCGKPTEKLCDFPVTRDGKKTTCDAKMCSGCTKKVGKNIDYCPPHARYHERKNRCL